MLTAIFLQPLAAMKFDLWPSQLPMVVQVTLALMIAEFGLYWAHRIAHETVFFWRFHALHHSVVRLWVVNTGRFHVADSLFKIALSQIPALSHGRAVAGVLVARGCDRLHRHSDPLQCGYENRAAGLRVQHAPVAPLAPLQRAA